MRVFHESLVIVVKMVARTPKNYILTLLNVFDVEIESFF